MKYIHYLFFFMLILISVFIYDKKSVEMKIMEDKFPEIENLEKQLKECFKNGSGKPCEIIKKKIQIVKERKPSLISMFFIWISDALISIFKSISLYNFILLIILLISIKFIIFD